MDYTILASAEQIEKTVAALHINGITAYVASNGKEAKEKLFSLMPHGSSVMNMTSMTLESIGVAQEIQESGKYDSIRQRLYGMSRATQSKEMRELGAAPDWAVGSVHAVTEDGKVMIASNTGSQLPAYAYGAEHVIWVVGAQKIVKNVENGFKRIYEHCLPLESERAKKAYGAPGSAVNKVLIMQKEVQENRISLIFVNGVLGF